MKFSFLPNLGRCLLRWMSAFGWHPRVTWGAWRAVPGYFRDFVCFVSRPDPDWPTRPDFPCLLEKEASAGNLKDPYFLQDFFVARKICERNPVRHIDVGSRIDGFVAHVAVFRQIEVIDIRPASSFDANVRFLQQNLMQIEDLPEAVTDSLSCLHALEHFGLGRYGDPIKKDGWKDGLRGLAKLLRAGGILYLSVPVGRQRVEFNAHRIFHPETLVAEAQKNQLSLIGFHWIDASGTMKSSPSLEANVDLQLSGLSYGLGIFEFLK